MYVRARISQAEHIAQIIESYSWCGSACTEFYFVMSKEREREREGENSDFIVQ